MRDEKLRAAVARSTFASEKAKDTSRSEMFGALFEVEMSKKCTALRREAHVEVKSVQNTPGSEHFLKLRCRKSARRCGAKHISKSKCTKHSSSGALLEVEMSKKCMSLWREAHFGSQHVQNTPAPAPDHFWKLRC